MKCEPTVFANRDARDSAITLPRMHKSTCSVKCFESTIMERPAKQRRALLESNPLRNNRLELIAWLDGKLSMKDFPSGCSQSHAIDFLCLRKLMGGVGSVGRSGRTLSGYDMFLVERRMFLVDKFNQAK